MCYITPSDYEIKRAIKEQLRRRDLVDEAIREYEDEKRMKQFKRFRKPNDVISSDRIGTRRFRETGRPYFETGLTVDPGARVRVYGI